jgi:hypothetical protein
VSSDSTASPAPASVRANVSPPGTRRRGRSGASGRRIPVPDVVPDGAGGATVSADRTRARPPPGSNSSRGTGRAGPGGDAAPAPLPRRWYGGRRRAACRAGPPRRREGWGTGPARRRRTAHPPGRVPRSPRTAYGPRAHGRASRATRRRPSRRCRAPPAGASPPHAAAAFRQRRAGRDGTRDVSGSSPAGSRSQCSMARRPCGHSTTHGTAGRAGLKLRQCPARGSAGQSQLACSGLPSAYPAALWTPTSAFSANSASVAAPA